TYNAVRNAPTIQDIAPIIKNKFLDNIICSYGPFDRSSLQRIFPELNNDWLDIIKVVRRSWNNQFSQKGYGLAKVAKKLNIKQTCHHNALDDVKTAGGILLKALNDSNEGLDFWLKRVNKPINQHSLEDLTVNSEGPFYGETIAFTGTLSISRNDAAQRAANAGCLVVNSISKKVTMLVLGIQDFDKLRGKELSNKEIKVKELIEKGYKIQILSEQDFFNLINMG
ncbi:TPA: hypothetical protein QB446_002163, partial [Pasteurella multocida]|nr:hypothetical protein [Pasteurella multocida]